MTTPIVKVYTSGGTPAWQSGLFIVIAALVGAGVALLSTRLSDRRREKRDDDTRWDNSIRDAAGNLLGAITNAVRLTGVLQGLVDDTIGRSGASLWYIFRHVIRSPIRLTFIFTNFVPMLRASGGAAKARGDVDRSFSDLSLVAPGPITQLASVLIGSLDKFLHENFENSRQSQSNTVARERFTADHKAFVELVRSEIVSDVRVAARQSGP